MKIPLTKSSSFNDFICFVLLCMPSVNGTQSFLFLSGSENPPLSSSYVFFSELQAVGWHLQ
jgi:hypothetical protein